MSDAEVTAMQIEMAKLRERIVGHRDDIEDAKKHRKEIDARVTALEKKMIFVSGLAAGGGGLIGALFGKALTIFGG